MLTIKNTWKTRTKLITAHVEQASESPYCPALSSYPFSSSQETDIRDLAPSSLGAGLPLHHKASNYSGTGLFGQGVNEQEKLPQVQAKHNQTKHPHRIKRLGAISSFALSSTVAWGKSPCLSEPQFPPVERAGRDTYQVDSNQGSHCCV